MVRRFNTIFRTEAKSLKIRNKNSGCIQTISFKKFKYINLKSYFNPLDLLLLSYFVANILGNAF